MNLIKPICFVNQKISSFQLIKHACCLKFQIANVHKTNNKKQPPEVFCKKLFLKVCQYSLETPVLEFFLTQNTRLQFWGVIKKKFRHSCFSLNITKLKKTYFKKICERLLLNNVKRDYSSVKTAKKLLNVSQHSQENTCTRVSFLININAALNLRLSLLKKKLLRRCFLDSHPKFLTTTFLTPLNRL